MVDKCRKQKWQGSEKPGFFLKKPNPVGFLGFIGFYWVLGFIGFFLDKQEKIDKIIQKQIIYLRQ